MSPQAYAPEIVREFGAVSITMANLCVCILYMYAWDEKWQRKTLNGKGKDFYQQKTQAAFWFNSLNRMIAFALQSHWHFHYLENIHRIIGLLKPKIGNE